jgi:O-antigen/teichoic acid export membrane protein
MKRATFSPTARAGGVWFMVALAATGAGNMGFHVVVSRMLGPVAYGAFGSLLALLVLVSVPATGFQVLVTARAARIAETDRPADGTVLFGRALTVGGVCTVIMLVAAPLIQGLLRLYSIWPVLWLALYCLPLAAVVVPWGFLCGRRRFGLVGSIMVASMIVRIGVAVMLVRSGSGVSGAVAASVIADSLQALALYRASGGLRADPPADAVPLRVDVRTAAGGMVAFVGLWLLAGADTIAARRLLDPVLSGCYSAAVTALHGALYGAHAVSLAALPAFAAIDVERSRRALLRALLSAAALVGPVALVLTIASPRLVPMVFGGAFQVPITVVALIAVVTMGLTLLWVLVQYNIARSLRGAYVAWLGLPIAMLGAAYWHADMLALATVMVPAVFVPLAVALWSWLARRPAPAILTQAGSGLHHPAASVDLTVVVPFYNPGPALRPNLLRLVDVLQGCGLRYEVVAVDDGCTDGSAATVADLDPAVIRLLTLPYNQGKGSALRLGLQAGRGGYLGFIDADGDLDPALWHSFAQLIRLYRPDAIVGDRRHPLTAMDRYASWTRNICSLGYRSLVWLLFPTLPVRDTQVGLKVFRRDVLANVLPRCQEQRFVLDVELLALATRLGYRRILAAPVSLYRLDRSTVTPLTLVRMFVDTAHLALRLYVLDSYRLTGLVAAPVTNSWLDLATAQPSDAASSELSADQDDGGNTGARAHL